MNDLDKIALLEHNCKNCAFFRAVGAKEGNCVRFPPVGYPMQIQGPLNQTRLVVASQPLPVMPTHWCGEWEATRLPN